MNKVRMMRNEIRTDTEQLYSMRKFRLYKYTLLQLKSSQRLKTAALTEDGCRNPQLYTPFFQPFQYTFKYREISCVCVCFCHKKEERKGLNYNTLCQKLSFRLFIFFLIVCLFLIMQKEFVVVTDIEVIYA